MSKRFSCFTLIVVFLTFTGCYQVSQVSMTEFMEVHHPAEAYFQTGDTLAYHAGKAGYRVASDSLYINGFKLFPDDTRRPFRGVVPVSSVSAVNVRTIDNVGTVLVLSSALILGVALIELGDMDFHGGVGGGWK